MSVVEARYCAMGERCKLYDLEKGKSQKLDRYHRSEICDRCRAAGYTPDDALILAPSSAPDKEPSAWQDWKCEVCGKPAVACFSGWKLLFAADGKTDYDPSEEVYFCQEHLEYLDEEGPIAVFSPADERPSPSEEVFGEVFRAAKVLFRENILDEELIIPTLAFANQASALSELKTLRERFAAIADDRERREQFSTEFEQRFRGLTPIGISDDVLVLKTLPISVDVSRYPDTSILKEIRINVFMRHVKPPEVAARYKWELEQAGVPYDESTQASVGYRSSGTYLSIVVDPGKDLDVDQVARLSSRDGQLTFPPPMFVRDNYASAKGSVTKKRFRGLGYSLGGRQSGDAAKADNLIPACVAWYLREQGGIADDHRVATLLNRELLEGCSKTEVRAKSGEAIWKSIDKVGDSIKRVELTLQMGL